MMARVKSGLSPDEVLATLAKDQQIAVHQVRFGRALEVRAQQDLVQQTEELKRLVAEALSLGVPATLLANSLGVTRARVYQMKDEIRAEKPLSA